MDFACVCVSEKAFINSGVIVNATCTGAGRLSVKEKVIRLSKYCTVLYCTVLYCTVCPTSIYARAIIDLGGFVDK